MRQTLTVPAEVSPQPSVSYLCFGLLLLVGPATGWLQSYPVVSMNVVLGNLPFSFLLFPCPLIPAWNGAEVHLLMP